ncbi:hypothetical protein Nmel_011647 [Mimus melanotis]
MDDGAESLMTVHLLTHLGHSFPLQQTLDRLLEWLCLDIRLFLVSERVPPLKYYERYRKRSRSFPGISVLLFLHEDLGEERIFQVHEQFQRPPWRYQRAQFANGQSLPYGPSQQDFYGLDEQLPVWGIRRVHCGPEILRVTLYCSFENYEDAARLYEMILQREATLQSSTSCVFMLHSTPHVAVQLCLKQLPIGVVAEPRDSAALQFKVQEIGQLVPLLPNPCVPISSTRWQTQDYEGNTILLKVQSSSRTLETNIGFSQQYNNTGSGKIPLDCVPAPLPVQQSNPGRRSQEIRALKGETKSNPSDVLVFEQASSDLQRLSCSAPRVPAARPCWEATSLRRQGGRLQAPLPESRRHRGTETDVDTGLAVGSARCPLSLFPRALRSSLQPLPSPGTLRSSLQPLPSPRTGTGTGAARPAQDGTRLLRAAARRSKAEHGAPQTPRASPAHRAEHQEEEEFFI